MLYVGWLSRLTALILIYMIKRLIIPSNSIHPFLYSVCHVHGFVGCFDWLCLQGNPSEPHEFPESAISLHYSTCKVRRHVSLGSTFKSTSTIAYHPMLAVASYSHTSDFSFATAVGGR